MANAPHVCFSSSFSCSGAISCAECRTQHRTYVTVPAMQAAGLTNAQAEMFFAASEMALTNLHEQMANDPVLAAHALDVDRVERALALLDQVEHAQATQAAQAAQQASQAAAGAAVGQAPSGASGRLMDPHRAMEYMDDVTRRAQAVMEPSVQDFVPPGAVAVSQVEQVAEPGGPALPAGPSMTEHAAALVTRELLANPAFLQSVLASGIAAVQTAAASEQAEHVAEQAADEVEDVQDAESASADGAETEAPPADGDGLPSSVPPARAPQAHPVVEQQAAAPRVSMQRDQRIASLVAPMDLEDIAAAAEPVSMEDLASVTNVNSAETEEMYRGGRTEAESESDASAATIDP